MELKGQSWLVLPELLEAGQFHEQRPLDAEEWKEKELGRRRKKREDGSERSDDGRLAEGEENGIRVQKAQTAFLSCAAAQFSAVGGLFLSVFFVVRH